MRKCIAMLLSLLLVVSLTACGAKPDYAVKYHVKINPEFDVYADEDLTVLWVEAVNEDAEAVLSNIQVEGISVADAFSVITEEAKAEGFMTEEKGNTVEITIDEIDEKVLDVCPVCGGGGTLTCWYCGGTANRKCACENGLDECGHCHGTGEIDCDCDGGVEVCADCGGEGWKVCDQCGGTGKLENTCFNCGGTGNCPDCGGRGYVIVTAGDTGNVVYNADGTPETGGCEGCHSTGICQVCSNNPFCPACCEHKGPDGTIRNPGGIPGRDQCSACGGDGISECPYCEGIGSFRCEDCGGSGQSTCGFCGGSTYVPCGCELNGRRWCPCCWGSGVDGTGMENYNYALSPEENMFGAN